MDTGLTASLVVLRYPEAAPGSSAFGDKLQVDDHNNLYMARYLLQVLQYGFQGLRSNYLGQVLLGCVNLYRQHPRFPVFG